MNDTAKNSDQNTPMDLDPLAEKIEALESELLSAQQKFTEAEEQRLRALADLQNYQRREASQKASWSSMAVGGFVGKIIPRLNEMQTALSHSTDEAFKKVVETFFVDLEKNQLTAISPAAETPVDPNRHEVLMSAEGTPGTVVQTLEPGWQYQDQVIQPAKVSACPEN